MSTCRKFCFGFSRFRWLSCKSWRRRRCSLSRELCLKIYFIFFSLTKRIAEAEAAAVAELAALLFTFHLLEATSKCVREREKKRSCCSSLPAQLTLREAHFNSLLARHFCSLDTCSQIFVLRGWTPAATTLRIHLPRSYTLYMPQGMLRVCRTVQEKLLNRWEMRDDELRVDWIGFVVGFDVR